MGDRSPHLRAAEGRRGSNGRTNSPVSKSGGGRNKRTRPDDENAERWWEGLAGRRRTGSARRPEQANWSKSDGGSIQRPRRGSGGDDNLLGPYSTNNPHDDYPPNMESMQPIMEPQMPPDAFRYSAAMAYPPQNAQPYSNPQQAQMPAPSFLPPAAQPVMYAVPMVDPQQHVPQMYQQQPNRINQGPPPRVVAPNSNPPPAIYGRRQMGPNVTVDDGAKFINCAQSAALNVMAAVGLPFLQNELMVAEAKQALPEEAELYAIIAQHLAEKRNENRERMCAANLRLAEKLSMLDEPQNEEESDDQPTLVVVNKPPPFRWKCGGIIPELRSV